jgi:hypothetical protein
LPDAQKLAFRFSRCAVRRPGVESPLQFSAREFSTPQADSEKRVMRLFSRPIFFLVLSLAGLPMQAQTSTPESKATGSIAGRVTVAGRPASGFKVVALQGSWYDSKVVAVASTDADGHFHLRGLAAGHYEVTVDNSSFARAKKAPAKKQDDSENPAKEDEEDVFSRLSALLNRDGVMEQRVKAVAGEEVRGIDFDLLPGGVITGRVTEANGRPIIAEDVRIEHAENKDGALSPRSYSKLSVETDDRGIYRAFGLTPGRYKVSVGEKYQEAGTYAINKVGIPLSYYTGATGNGEPAVIEVASGGEAINIDIKVSRPRRAETFAVYGRVVDAVTGKPLANVQVTARKQGGQYVSGLSGESDLRGEFRMDKFTPGNYTISIQDSSAHAWYGNKVTFEVSNRDIAGLEVKAFRMAGISGTVVLENSNNPQALAQLSKLEITVGPADFASKGMEDSDQVKADGSFHLTALQPQDQRAAMRLRLEKAPDGFTIVRIERDGVEQSPVFEVRAGEQISGVRIILAYYTAKIRGRITFENGQPTSRPFFLIAAILANDPLKSVELRNLSSQDWLDLSSRVKTATIDDKGDFTLKGLAPGEYEVTALFLAGSPAAPQKSVKTVVVPADGDVEVTFTFDLKKPEGEQR